MASDAACEDSHDGVPLMGAKGVRVILVDGNLLAEEHGPWCLDTKSFPPRPKCKVCDDKEAHGAHSD
jgi:hypothetical protein